jgi:hypothetical protein
MMRTVVGEAVDSGALAGDPDTLAHLFWSGVHGIVALHLAGKLALGRSLSDLIEPFIQLSIAGASPTRESASRPASGATPIRVDETPQENTP